MSTSLNEDFLRLIENSPFSVRQIEDQTETIFSTVLGNSKTIVKPNFESVSSNDLSLLFQLYDQKFFGGLCRKSLGNSPLDFRVSSRMTRAGGKTSRTIYRDQPNRPVYEITVSSTLLFDTFDDVERTILVTGLECENRLQALQRIFEHEMVHLIEMLLWKKSSCSQNRFQSIAARFFNHTDYQHQLVTPIERALKIHGVQQGSLVQFEFEGTKYQGVVNRITKRATVLVEDRKGRRYSDGKRYSKFYIPMQALELIQ